MLTALSKVLAPEGKLFLTTPNAIGLYPIREVGERRPASTYRPHYREYSPFEATALLKDAGLAGLLTTFESYPFHDYAAEREYLLRVGNVSARHFWGDSILALGWRPAGPDASQVTAAAQAEALVRVMGRPALMPPDPGDWLRA
jgi:hypothetical protein